MLRDPYRQLFLAANSISYGQNLAGLAGLASPAQKLIERLGLGFGQRVLMAGLAAPGILPNLRLKLGLAGQLLILDDRPDAFGDVSRYDADWVVLLKAKSSAIPVPDSSLDVVLCWSSFLSLGDMAPSAEEFFRVLGPGGKAIIAHGAPGAPAEEPRPCPFRLERLFLEAGFSRIDFEENREAFLLEASKVPGFYLNLSPAGRA
ncbi:MAG: methyltransferase domain-containing protein [Deltaproteobacteria bacterium]|jgi:SAM-dependent methyltransferase|nr:methyltransferase domain-containing protein [Deltaproteobacteria bacterium]